MKLNYYDQTYLGYVTLVPRGNLTLYWNALGTPTVWPHTAATSGRMKEASRGLKAMEVSVSAHRVENM